MEISQEFTVEAPVEAVWSYLTDPERVAEALPGAHLEERIDETTYKGGITMKVGPLSASYDGTVEFASLDPSTHTAQIVASGQGKRGMGVAQMRMTSSMSAVSAAKTRVKVVSDVMVTGVLAQLGKGMIQRISDQMLKDFTARMQQDLGG